MSWSCKKCTFLNPASEKSSCQVCLSPIDSFSPPVSSSSSVPKWACKACTFLNPYKNSNCEVCGTRAFVSSLSSFEDLNDTGADGDLDPSVGSVFLPLQPCKKRVRDPMDQDCFEISAVRGFKALKKDKEVVTVDITDSTPVVSSFKILTYNVWFREDLEVHKRMEALGNLIQLHSPDLICFQEVTSNIYDIFKRSSWWKAYQCSISHEMAYSKPYFCMQLSKMHVKSFSCKPFGNSVMGRELCVAEVEVEGDKGLVVATSHLESPCPAPPKWDQMYSKERVAQAKEAVNLLNKHPNVILCGDMNWDDKLDGQFPLPEGWVDAWMESKPGENGWTYDTKLNKMLSGNRTLQKRLDRVLCRLRDFKISEIDMIGKEAIAGITHVKEKKVKSEVKKLVLPVYPSDHFGLLLTIRSQ